MSQNLLSKSLTLQTNKLGHLSLP